MMRSPNVIYHNVNQLLSSSLQMHKHNGTHVSVKNDEQRTY